MQCAEPLVSAIRSICGGGRTLQTKVGGAARATLTVLLAVGMVLLSPGATSMFTVRAQSGTEAGGNQLDALFATYRSFVELVDPVEIDIDELSFELAFETPDAIADWVTSNIAYHPYQGLLRGPSGTLLARGGNTLDQAVLLARLLNDAGYEARIAWAELPQDRAGELWSQASPPPQRERPAQPAADAATERALLTDEQISDAQEQIQQASDALETRFVRERDALISTLRDGAGPAWEADGVPPSLYETTYAWVDVRATPDAPWERIHPAFAAPPEWLATVEPVGTSADSVPAELQHRLRFQVIIEQRLGEELEEKPIMEAWERPVANLVGSSFSFASMPDTFSDPSSDSDAAFADATFIYPLFNDELAPGAQLFDLNGNTAPPEAAASPAAGVVQNVGNAFGGAVGALTGDEEPVALTAQWLEFTLIEPGGRERTYRRAVFDRVGVENRLMGSTELQESVGPDAVVRALKASHSFMLDPGSYPADFVQYRTAERVLSHEGYLRTLFTEAPSASVSQLAPPKELTATMRTFEHLRQFLVFDARETPADVITFRNRPALSLISKSWDGSRGMTDVIQNDRVSLVLAEGEEPRLAPSHAQAMGVWETVTEGIVLTGGDEAFSVPAFMEAVRAQGVPMVVIDPSNPAALEEVSAPVDSLEAMRSDLERGYLVVAADRVPEGMPHAAWWRVDPLTGVTLGRGIDGRGVQENVGYITLSGLTISTFFGIAGVGSCLGSGGSGSCCLAEGAGWFVIGFLLGAAVGAIGVKAGMTKLAAAEMGFGVGAAFDFASLNMGLAGILPTTCTSSGRPVDGASVLAAVDGHELAACDATQILRVYLQDAIVWRGSRS